MILSKKSKIYKQNKKNLSQIMAWMIAYKLSKYYNMRPIKSHQISPELKASIRKAKLASPSQFYNLF